MIRWRAWGWRDGGFPTRETAVSGLCADERQRLASFKVPKRRDDWLVGRVNAKTLLAQAITERYGVVLPPEVIHVARAPSGAPVVRILPHPLSARLPSPLPLSVSNSHSEGHALCAVAWTDDAADGRPVRAVGVDLEWVEPRSEAFVNDFLTPAERAFCHAVDGADRDLRANLAWSAKEAVLKVVQRGLTVDTYWLSCTPPADPLRPTWLTAAIAPERDAWAPLAVAFDPRFPTHGLTFDLAWRRLGGFVATLAVGR